jgi:hypothetical protein
MTKEVLSPEVFGFRIRKGELKQGNGQAAKKKCKERELLKLAYWKINRPK